MTSSFTADPQALTAAAQAFSAQVDPINTAATKAEQIQGGPGNAGRDYSAQGTAYHAAVTTLVQTLFTPMATKTTWVSDTLSGTAASYTQSDQSATTGLNTAGEGA